MVGAAAAAAALQEVAVGQEVAAALPCPDPSPPSGGGPGPLLHVNMIVIHIANGVLMLGVVGLVVSIVIGVGRGAGCLVSCFCPSLGARPACSA